MFLIGTATTVEEAIALEKSGLDAIVAQGSVMDGRWIVAALALGASAVQMGTAFLTCHEAGIPGDLQANHPHRTRRSNAHHTKRLERAESVIVEDPETMIGTPVYRGTRIPVELIADMLNQDASIEEILEGYPALDREKIELAPLYMQAFPRRGRPAARPWTKRKAVRTTRHRRTRATPT